MDVGERDPVTDQLVVAPTDENCIWIERKALTDADYEMADGSAITTELIFNDLTDGEPATMKMAQQCSFLFKRNGMSSLTALFASEIHPAFISVALEQGGWGMFAAKLRPALAAAEARLE